MHTEWSPLALLPFLSLMYPIPLFFFLGLKTNWRKKVNKPRRTKYYPGNITWFLAETCRHHCSNVTLVDVKPCWGSAASNGFAQVELSSISPPGSAASLSSPKCCVLCHPPCQPHTQQCTGFFSSFSFNFWWNMTKFLCLRPLVFCQIGWNCSTGSKYAWGKIANWQMARQHSHICLISWRNRLKMHH